MDSGDCFHRRKVSGIFSMGGRYTIGDGSVVEICGIKNIRLIPNSAGGVYTSRVLYIPGLVICEGVV